MEKDTVYIVDLDTKSLCYHSTLPVEMKEVHAYELNGKLMVCSTFTSSSSKKLQCFTWSGANGWEGLIILINVLLYIRKKSYTYLLTYRHYQLILLIMAFLVSSILFEFLE